MADQSGWISFEVAQDESIAHFDTEIECLRDVNLCNKALIEKGFKENDPKILFIALAKYEENELDQFLLKPVIDPPKEHSMFIAEKLDENNKPWVVRNPNGTIYDRYNSEYAALGFSNMLNRCLTGHWPKEVT